MDFIEYTYSWVKSEATQGKIMIFIGVLLLVAFVGIIRSHNELLRGTLIPMTLLLTICIGYGGYILYSRPAHVKQSITLYQQSEKEAIEKEQTKHINDNKAGKTLMKIYPILILVSIIALLFVANPYYKGMAIGFAVLFIAFYVIDFGFVSRSDAFLSFLSKLKTN
ncbi:DUF2178 domain-containing protein [Candidatus Kapabacteria bacterium]|nr:DUF2178 domain-containing protein [Candidatus Kapabacteria bacterium]